MLVPQKLGKILENKVVQKLKLETLYSPKEMLSKIDIIKLKFKKKNLSPISTSKLQFWQFLTDCHSSRDFVFVIFF